MGYFRIPAVWIEAKPAGIEAENDVVVETTLANGLKVIAFRCGMFVFDFSNTDFGSQVLIPGFSYPNPPIPHRRPVKTEEAYKEVGRSVLARTKLVNVHQFLLTQSERDIAKRGAMSGLVYSPRDLTRAISVGGCLNFRPHAENIISISRAYLSGEFGGANKVSRRILEPEVVSRAADLLDKLLIAGGSDGVTLLDQLFVARELCAEGRVGIGVASIWAVLEKFIFADWKEYISSQRDVINKKRREKLNGMNYTSSIVLDNLNLLGVYEEDLFLALDSVRQLRNNWMHNLKEPDNDQMGKVSTAVSMLVRRHLEVELRFDVSSYQGSDASWPIWLQQKR